MAHKYSAETAARVGSICIMTPKRVGMALAALERTPEQIQLRADAEFGRQMRFKPTVIVESPNTTMEIEDEAKETQP